MTWPRCVLVGVDSSAESLAALDLVLELATATGARAIAVHAVGLLEEGGYRPRPDLARLVQDALHRTDATAVIETCSEDGPPVDVVLRVAAREGGDLIVVGSRGVGGSLHQLGSTSEELVTRSHLPVMVVPHPEG